ncbi:hypothetical protein T492DRAFT_839977 [Pavlovales sp. CCMP2436]|nr:hypothetical protein T492DRAFT_839977 [Pavlovales sp. CCMP2436]
MPVRACQQTELFGGRSHELLEHIFTFCDPVDVTHVMTMLDLVDVRTIALATSPLLDAMLLGAIRRETTRGDVFDLRPPLRPLRPPRPPRGAQWDTYNGDISEDDDGFWANCLGSDPPRRDQMELVSRSNLRTAMARLHWVQPSASELAQAPTKQPFTAAELAQVAAGLYAHGGERKREDYCFEEDAVYSLPRLDGSEGPRSMFCVSVWATFGGDCGIGCCCVGWPCWYSGRRVIRLYYNLAPLSSRASHCEVSLQIAQPIGIPFLVGGDGVHVAEPAVWERTCSSLGIGMESGRLGQIVQLLLLAATGREYRDAWGSVVYTHCSYDKWSPLEQQRKRDSLKLPHIKDSDLDAYKAAAKWAWQGVCKEP